MKPHNKLGLNSVLWKGKQFLPYMWHPLCYSSYKPGELMQEEMTGEYFFYFLMTPFNKQVYVIGTII